jgi:hypothetical protein
MIKSDIELLLAPTILISALFTANIYGSETLGRLTVLAVTSAG